MDKPKDKHGNFDSSLKIRFQDFLYAFIILWIFTKDKDFGIIVIASIAMFLPEENEF